MTSCGNPASEHDALMQRRARFDRTTDCIKCKAERGNIVVRHAVYCKACFFLVNTAKFRRSLESHVDVADRHAGRSMLAGFSGGVGSTVLLDAIDRCYFPPSDSATKGGNRNPRNKRMWGKVYVCYVERCDAFPKGQMKDRTKEALDVVSEYKNYDIVISRIQDVFDPEWWKKMGGSDYAHGQGVDLSNEDLPVVPIIDFSSDPVTNLRSYLSSLPTPTAVQAAIATLTRLILVYTAKSLHCSHVALGTSLTSLSINLITSIAQGGGFNIPEESYEEWQAESSNEGDVGDATPRIRIVRPLRDIGMKECTAWVWWRGLRVVGRERLPIATKQSIGGLTEEFIVGLERDYPSTVSAITRTCAKVTPKDQADLRCIICERPCPKGVLDWKSRISIRSLPKDASDSSSDDAAIVPVQHPADPSGLARRMCYACHTMFVSRTSKSASSIQGNIVPLPMWTRLALSLEEDMASGTSDAEEEEVMVSVKMNEFQMKDTIGEFLLEE